MMHIMCRCSRIERQEAMKGKWKVITGMNLIGDTLRHKEPHPISQTVHIEDPRHTGDERCHEKQLERM